MTDVFICYSREDRERVRPIAEGLKAEGWEVWWDPAALLPGETDSVDRQLGSAGAVLVVWSAASRASEYVRSEAATGLYKNKLIQTRIDQAQPPRPFDQVEVLDLGAWSGDREDPVWRRVVGATRLFAGSPGVERPQVMRRASRAAPVDPRDARDAWDKDAWEQGGWDRGAADMQADYLTPRRGLTVGPMIAAAALVVVAAGFWLLDPLGWRAPVAASADGAGAGADPTLRSIAANAASAPSPPSPADASAAEIAWAGANRNSPTELRGLVAAYPGTSAAESARSVLRVLDAQAWADAVTADTEKAYAAYLQAFPANGDTPGAMAAAALERLQSLAGERAQAMADVQRALVGAKLYRGKADGQASDATVRAVRAFARAHNRPMIDLKAAAPRDLRAFADLVNAVGGKPVLQSPSAAAPPPPLTAAGARPVAAPAPSSAVAAADRQRVADADAARRTAETLAADALAATEAQRREARPPRPSYGLAQLPASVRRAVESARQAQSAAVARAAAARGAATRADAVAAAARSGAPGAQVLTAADGALFESQVAAGAPNGLGVKVAGPGVARGDRYRGELRAGLGAGLGVYEFADNPNNAGSAALRYEGEHVADQAAGLGVTYWRNGDTFAGDETAGGTGRGVLSFANGQRYEGEMAAGRRSGYGVVWSADGQVLQAGRFDNGTLVEPATLNPAAPPTPATPSVATPVSTPSQEPTPSP